MIFYQIEKTDSFSNDELTNVFNKLSVSQQTYLLKKKEDKIVQSLAVRALLDRLLSARFEKTTVNALVFDKNNAPIISGEQKLFVSFSHSGSMVACAVSDMPIGIDIERIREVNTKTAEKACTEEELALVRSDEKETFFKLWTLKEAYIKAVGGGFCKMKKKSFVKDGSVIMKDGIFRIEQGQKDGYIWSIYYR